MAKELIDLLTQLSPRPEQIMSSDDGKAIDRLRRREAMNKDRAKRLGDRAKQLGGELPGETANELGTKLGAAVEQMGQADERMKQKDPSGTARSDALGRRRARQGARSRAAAPHGRRKRAHAVGDEPIRIPGADEYKAPARFREDLIEGMKCKGADSSKCVPDGYQEMVERYRKELLQ